MNKSGILVIAMIAAAGISPVSAAETPFMNEQACSVLQETFFTQPARKEAAKLLKPCLEALSARYGAPLRLAPRDKGFNLLVGDYKNPGNDLRDALRADLKEKAKGQFLGYKVVLCVPRAGLSANKSWGDDYNTVVEYIEDNTAIDGALEGAGMGAVIGAGSPPAIIVGAVIGAVVDAWDD